MLALVLTACSNKDSENGGNKDKDTGTETASRDDESSNDESSNDERNKRS
ncbi:MAG: hypothetical protein J6B60_03005 [Clostridia bacterium]|nr:hypothetical protein [Clostridia bacterium]